MDRPSVGIGVLISQGDKYLLGQRIGKHGYKTWSVPGGYLEFGETFEECAKRETLEETGIAIKNIKFLTTVNNLFEDEDHHSITIFMTADIASGKPTTKEPDKFIEVGWYELNSPPGTLFLPVLQLKKVKPELFNSRH